MSTKHYIPVLSIAGSDCSGGAGIQADIKTISALGCYAMTAITSITAQNTTGVSLVEGITPRMVAKQIEMVWADIPPLAVKTGMLYSRDIVQAVGSTLSRLQVSNLVVDPVMISTSGSRLIAEDAVQAMVSELFPLAALVTPNRLEAEVLTGHTDVGLQAAELFRMGCRAILLKGGDADSGAVKTDWLCLPDREPIALTSPAIDTPNTHGTGCTLSSAIASYLAMGRPMEQAVREAKRYISAAIASGADYSIGRGHGPVNHFWQWNS